MADGSLPAGEVKDKFRATAPFRPTVPDDSVRESGPVCPKETRAATTANNAIWLRVESLFMGPISVLSSAINDSCYNW